MSGIYSDKKLIIRDIILIGLAVLTGGAPVISLHKLTNELIKKFYKSNHSIADAVEIKAFRNALTKLKKDKMVENYERGFWKITKIGYQKTGILNRFKIYDSFKTKNKNKSPDTLIIFDVPEVDHRKRDYLRNELVALGYQQLQKSVWIGHSPLPTEFINYLNDLKLFGFIQIFTIKEFGTLGSL